MHVASQHLELTNAVGHCLDRKLDRAQRRPATLKCCLPRRSLAHQHTGTSDQPRAVACSARQRSASRCSRPWRGAWQICFMTLNSSVEYPRRASSLSPSRSAAASCRSRPGVDEACRSGADRERVAPLNCRLRLCGSSPDWGKRAALLSLSKSLEWSLFRLSRGMLAPGHPPRTACERGCRLRGPAPGVPAGGWIGPKPRPYSASGPPAAGHLSGATKPDAVTEIAG